jgi:hypothetical protein
MDRAVATFSDRDVGPILGDLTRHTRQGWQDLLGRLSIEERDRHLGVRDYERSSPDRTDARNGFL